MITANVSDYLGTTHLFLKEQWWALEDSDQRVDAVPAKAVRESLAFGTKSHCKRARCMPDGRYEAVCGGRSRIRQIVSELQILWSAEHDKLVPKLILCGCSMGVQRDP